MNSRLLRLTATLALLTLTSAALAADEAYAIKLHRPCKVGDQYDTHMIFNQTATSTMTPPNAPSQVKTESLNGDLTGRVQVKEVDKNGEPVGMVITVKKFTDGAGKELVESGKALQIDRGESEVTVKLVDGGEVSEDTTKLLQLMIHKHPANSPNDDDIFGTSDSRKVGDSWKINSELAAKSASDAGVAVTAKDITGTVTLKGVEGSGDAKSLQVEGTMDAKGVKPASPNPQLSIDSCDMHAEYSGKFPVNTAALASTMTTKMTLDIQMSAGEMKIDVKAKTSETETKTPVK